MLVPRESAFQKDTNIVLMPLSKAGRREIDIYYLCLMYFYTYLPVINDTGDDTTCLRLSKYQMVELDSDPAPCPNHCI